MNTKQLLLKSFYTGIVHLWVHPLEESIIPRLEAGEPGRARRALLNSAGWAANAGRTAVLDGRLSVQRWIGPEWAVTYIGEGVSAEAIRWCLFPEQAQVEIEEGGHVSLWQAPALTRRWLEQGDLVVSETNQIVRWPVPGYASFSTPPWVSQILDGIDRPLEEIVAGMNQTLRRHIRQAEKQGYRYEFTHRQSDFDLFYHRMYLPYISTRHAGRGGSIQAEDFLRHLFGEGGLILLRLDDQPACAMLCKLLKGTCNALQMGVLDGRFDLVEQGANVALFWSMLDWARSSGASRYNLGASRAQCANGTFNFKRQWGARVYADPDVFSRWNFYIGAASEGLRRRINDQGFISLEAGGHSARQVYLPARGESPASEELAARQRQAITNGLDGVALVGVANQ